MAAPASRANAWTQPPRPFVQYLSVFDPLAVSRRTRHREFGLWHSSIRLSLHRRIPTTLATHQALVLFPSLPIRTSRVYRTRFLCLLLGAIMGDPDVSMQDDDGGGGGTGDEYARTIHYGAFEVSDLAPLDPSTNRLSGGRVHRSFDCTPKVEIFSNRKGGMNYTTWKQVEERIGQPRACGRRPNAPYPSSRVPLQYIEPAPGYLTKPCR